jgi:hypothetical protein
LELPAVEELVGSVPASTVALVLIVTMDRELEPELEPELELELEPELKLEPELELGLGTEELDTLVVATLDAELLLEVAFTWEPASLGAGSARDGFASLLFPHGILSPFGWRACGARTDDPSAPSMVKRVVHVVFFANGDVN